MRPLRALLPLLLLLTACSSGQAAPSPEPFPGPLSWAPRTATVDGLAVSARAAKGRFVLPTRGGDRDFLPGVDLGATTPGHFPGELSIPASLYRTWFAQMADVGVRVVRVYTLHPPAFYDELDRYNAAHPDAPLLLMQGAYLPDESYATTGDVWAAAPTTAFLDEIDDVVAAVHGDLERPAAPGRASGTWTKDVSRWLVGYVLGIEMDPVGVSRSDARNAGRAAYAGTWVSTTAGATSTEAWLAQALDRAAVAMAKRGRSVPLAFTNWPTTDPLRHPGEPLVDEDLVGLDANHLVAPRWPAGMFASYHAYPYYPDFQREEYQSFRFHGRVDPYAGYLSALKAHHAASGLPVVLTELGVPSSLGISHVGPLDRDQGDHSEQEALAIDADLVGVAKGLGLSGALLFAWADEPFKFTWNTIERDLPAERRALWRDAQTNEQAFGLVSVDPKRFRDVVLDGKVKGYTTRLDGDGVALSLAQDEQWLYLAVAYDPATTPAPLVGVDVVPGATARTPEGLTLSASTGADVAIRLPEGGAAPQLLVRAGADWVNGRYAVANPWLPRATGEWVPLRQLIGRPGTHARTGRPVPVEVVDRSQLRLGSSDPDDPAFDTRARAALGTDGPLRVVEMRVEWAALGFSDPSSRTALVMAKDGSFTTSVVPDIGLSVSSGGRVALKGRWTWPTWEQFPGSYRLKTGIGAVRDALLAAGS